MHEKRKRTSEWNNRPDWRQRSVWLAGQWHRWPLVILKHSETGSDRHCNLKCLPNSVQVYSVFSPFLSLSLPLTSQQNHSSVSLQRWVSTQLSQVSARRRPPPQSAPQTGLCSFWLHFFCLPLFLQCYGSIVCCCCFFFCCCCCLPSELCSLFCCCCLSCCVFDSPRHSPRQCPSLIPSPSFFQLPRYRIILLQTVALNTDTPKGKGGREGAHHHHRCIHSLWVMWSVMCSEWMSSAPPVSPVKFTGIHWSQQCKARRHYHHYHHRLNGWNRFRQKKKKKSGWLRNRRTRRLQPPLLWKRRISTTSAGRNECRSMSVCWGIANCRQTDRQASRWWPSNRGKVPFLLLFLLFL